MSEYWKSLPKFECPYCKVWVTDNKPSRDHHERGQRHKDKVARKLDDLRKKGMSDAKQEKFVEHSMRQLEKAALASFQNDIQNDPALAEKYKNVKFPSTSKPNKEIKKEVKQEPGSKSKSTSDGGATTQPNVNKQSDWLEKDTLDGHTYFHNPKTGENLKRRPTDNTNMQAVKENIKIEKNALKKEAAQVSKTGLGGWTTVTQEAPLDLDLPAAQTFTTYKKADNNVYEAKRNCKELEFTEKTVSALKRKDTTGEGDADKTPAVGFKKRRANFRNIRKKNDDE